MNSFFNTGTANDSLFTTQPIPFDVGPVALPEILKIMLGTVTVVLLGLAALVRFVLRRVRWHKASRQQGRAGSEQLLSEST